MTALSEANQHLKYFGEQLVPMIGYCQPEILKLTDESVEIKIPLNNETKNHLHSMYFGALAVGADAAGGFLAISKSEQMGKKIWLDLRRLKLNFWRVLKRMWFLFVMMESSLTKC